MKIETDPLRRLRGALVVSFRPERNHHRDLILVDGTRARDGKGNFAGPESETADVLNPTVAQSARRVNVLADESAGDDLSSLKEAPRDSG